MFDDSNLMWRISPACVHLYENSIQLDNANWALNGEQEPVCLMGFYSIYSISSDCMSIKRHTLNIRIRESIVKRQLNVTPEFSVEPNQSPRVIPAGGVLLSTRPPLCWRRIGLGWLPQWRRCQASLHPESSTDPGFRNPSLTRRPGTAGDSWVKGSVSASLR